MAITPVKFVLPPLNPISPARSAVEPPRASEDFASVLKNALSDVNKTLLDSERMDNLLAQGKLPNIHDAVIAAEKASLALSLAVQVRNRIVDAYQEVMRMTV